MGFGPLRISFLGSLATPKDAPRHTSAHPFAYPGTLQGPLNAFKHSGEVLISSPKLTALKPCPQREISKGDAYEAAPAAGATGGRESKWVAWCFAWGGGSEKGGCPIYIYIYILGTPRKKFSFF